MFLPFYLGGYRELKTERQTDQGEIESLLVSVLYVQLAWPVRGSGAKDDKEERYPESLWEHQAIEEI